MTTAAEFLEQTAARYQFSATKSSDGDYDLRPDAPLSKVAHPHASSPSVGDLMQLVFYLEKADYELYFQRDNSIHVHAPHRKEHNWGDRGWDCTHGLTIKGCEAFHGPATTSEKLKAGLRGRQLNQGS